MEILDASVATIVCGLLVLASTWMVWKSPNFYSLAALTVTSAFLFFFLSSECGGEGDHPTCTVFRADAVLQNTRSIVV